MEEKKVNFEIRKKMWKLVDKPKFLLLLAILITSSLLFVIAPIFLNNVVQNIGSIRAYDIVVVIVFLSLGYIVDFISVFFKNNLIQNYNSKAVPMLYEYVFDLKYDTYIEMGPTAIQDFVYNSANAYADYYFEVIPNLIINSMVIIVTIGIALTLNTLAAVLMFLILPIHYFGFKALNKKLSQQSVQLSRTSSESFKNINSVISQVDFIKQNPDNSFLTPSIRENIYVMEGFRKKVNYLANGASGLIIGLNSIIQTFIIIFLSSLALKNKELFGGVVYVMLILPYFSNSIRSLSATNLGISFKHAADDFFKTTLSDERAEDGISPAPLNVENISFDIDEIRVGEKLLLEDVHIKFHKGDVIGIIGESGKGKSTLVKLVSKFRKSGKVCINGIDISDIKNSEYLKLISYYSQNTPIITDTLYENLNFGRSPIDKKIYENMKFLDKFENLDEMIIEDGANLSGGDKQRIALSRYFTEDAQIVIFDEPTSSLDKNTETEILEEILANTENKIIFIVTHNLDILKYCTHIIEIKDKKAILKEN